MAEGTTVKFNKRMSTEELMDWLRERGLGEKDLEIVEGQWIYMYRSISGAHEYRWSVLLRGCNIILLCTHLP